MTMTLTTIYYYTDDIIAMITSVYIKAIAKDSSHPIFEEKTKELVCNSIYLGDMIIEKVLSLLNKRETVLIFSCDEEPKTKLPPEILFHKVKNNILVSVIEVFGLPKKTNLKVNTIQLNKLLALFDKENIYQKEYERQSKLKTHLAKKSLQHHVHITDIISYILSGEIDLDDFISELDFDITLAVEKQRQMVFKDYCF